MSSTQNNSFMSFASNEIEEEFKNYIEPLDETPK